MMVKTAIADGSITSEISGDQLLSGEQLMGLNDCAACHAQDRNMIGPSYNEISQKYDTDDETIKNLGDKVIKGGTGVWGRHAMTPHPELSASQAETMVIFILSIDAGVVKTRKPGIAADFYKAGVQLTQIPDMIPGQNPNISTVVPDLEFQGANASNRREANDFQGFEDYFVMHLSGFLDVAEKGTYEFMLGANVGGRFMIKDRNIVEVNFFKDWFVKREGVAELEAGPNPFRLEYYEDVYGSRLSLRWRRPGEKEYKEIPVSAFTHNPQEIKETSPGIKEVYEVNAPGYGASLESVHPSFDVTTVTPEGFNKRISAVEMLPNGWAAVSTWDETGQHLSPGRCSK